MSSGLDSWSVRAVEPVSGGLTCMLYQVRTSTGVYAFRVSRAGIAAELAVLERVAAAAVPVPRPIIVDATGEIFGRPFMFYRWIEGITLNACRRAHGEPALLDVAEALGRCLGTIGAVPVVGALTHSRKRIDEALAVAEDRLASSRARARLGARAADALAALFRQSERSLVSLEDQKLVHGDFGGRNLLVHDAPAPTFRLVGVLDWETVAVGSPLWDLGSLFRYEQRYSRAFRDAFEEGYRTSGEGLPADWWWLSRVLDATRVVEILAMDEDLPDVFEECCGVVASLTTT
jgi:aminoglycoside phosphotransferase (APT) family kinase protein